MAFDVEGARRAGYSDAEIADYLAKQQGFKVGDARRAGYSDTEIVSYLTSAKPKEEKGTWDTIKEYAGKVYDAADRAMQPVREAVGYDPEAEQRKTDQMAREIRARQQADIAQQDGMLDAAGDLFTRGMVGMGAGIERVASGLALNDAERQRFVNRARESEQIAKTKIAGETTWEEATSDITKLPGFLAEQAIASLPYMATAAVGRFGALANAASTTGQVAQSRAEADGRVDATAQDVGVAAPFGVASTALDSLALGSMFNNIGARGLGKAILVDAATEGFTEGVQSGLEYTGGSVGTKRGFNASEMASQMAQGAVVGFGVGGAFGGVTEGGKEAFDAAGRIAFRRPDDTRTPGPGIREEAIAGAINLTPEDMASPLDNADLAAGKAEIAAATSGAEVDAALTQAGLPKAGTKVSVSNLPGGANLTGTIEDVFSDETGVGVVVRPEGGGKAMREYLDTLNELGVSITPSDPLAEADAIDAALAAQAAAPMEVSSPLPSAGAETPSPRPSGRTPSKAAGGGVNSAIVEGLKKRGFSEGQALGIAAGIHAESASNPNAKNPTSGAMGLGQWLGPRKDAIRKRFGDNPTLDQQLDFLASELRGGDAGGKYVMAQSDPAKVLDAYVRKFMRPAAGAETDGDIARGMAALGQAPSAGTNDGQLVPESTTQFADRSQQETPSVEVTAPAPDLQSTPELPSSDDKFAQIEADFAANREVMSNFKKGQEVEWEHSSFYRDGSPRTFSGIVDRISEKNQGIVRVVSSTGGDYYVPARLLRQKASPQDTAGPQDGGVAATVKAPKAGGSPATAADSAASAGGAVTQARVEDTGTGKSVAVIGASEAEIAAISAAVPKAMGMKRKDGALVYSKKYADKIRAALAGVTVSVTPAENALKADTIDERAAKSGPAFQPADFETALNKNPERAIFDLSDDQVAKIGSKLGMRRGPKQSKAGFVEAMLGNSGLASTREAAVAVVNEEADRRRKMGAKPKEEALVIRNLRTGEEQSMPLPPENDSLSPRARAQLDSLKRRNANGEALDDADMVQMMDLDRKAKGEPTPAQRPAPVLKPTDQATIDLLTRMAEAEDRGSYVTIEIGSQRVKMMVAEGLIIENKGKSDAMWITSEKGRKILDDAGVPHAQSPKPTPAPSANRLVTDERAAELRERLKAKLNPNRLNSGIDPEIIAIGTELAVYHIEKGARRFQAFASAIAADLGMKVQDLRLYMRGWYNGARDMMEDAGESVAGMDTPDEVAKSMRTLETWANEPAVTGEAEAAPAPTKTSTADPVNAVRDHFLNGGRFGTIVEARKFLSEITGEDIRAGTPEAKRADETIEAAVVQAARSIAARNEGNPLAAYRALVDLYDRQPNLSVRSSTSVEQQAYSTPVPLAYLASRRAGIDQNTTVYEPTAGNGALLIDARATYVTANELNPDRNAQLRAIYRGAKISQEDASAYTPTGPQRDVVIGNPPFGVVKDEDGEARTFNMGDGYVTREIDHAISLMALDTMKNDGRAVLIVGSVNKQISTEKGRADAYNAKAKREFYYRLYREYNVTDHFTVAGELYSKQGAGWPVDVIVIEGRGKSALSLPAVKPPRIYDSWVALETEVEQGTRVQQATGGTAGNAAVEGSGSSSDPVDVAPSVDTSADAFGDEALNPDDTAKPVDNPAPDAPARIEDFGEQLVGARKDVWQSYKDRLSDAAEIDVTAEPLSKTWPEPDYQKLLDAGADPYVVAWVHAARDEIPTKPQKGWKLKGWAENVRLLRDTATKLLNDEIGADALVKRMSGELSRSLRDLQGRVDLYRDMGHSKSLKGVTFSQNYYSLYRGERDVTKWVVEKRAKATAFGNWPREIAVGDTREEALAKFKAIYDAGNLDAKADKIVRFDIYSRRGEPGFVIGKKIGKEYVDLKRFDTAKEARNFKISEEGYAELIAALDGFKDIPPERKASNAPRIGIDHRSGADVTPEAFAEAFGFRGVQFGNYVEGERRQSDLNEAYDALMDLAGVVGVPPRALSLNGELGLAFGARGKGGKGAAAAHFEPDTIVINLTKNKGAGSLAHEWWHSLDNYFSRMRAPGGYMTEGKIASTEGVRPEMVDAFKNVMAALRSTSLKERSKQLDKRRTKEYWATDIEMSARAFESYVIAKLQDEQFSNDYLANIVSEKAFGIEDGYPYLRAAEIPTVRAAFDSFFNAVETRETDRGLALYSMPEDTGDGAVADVRTSLQEQLASLRLAEKVKVRVVDTLGGAAGEYQGGIVTIATDTAQGEAFTLNHEAVHALRDLGMFTTSEWAILSAKAKRDVGLMRSIRQRYEAGFRKQGMSGPVLQEALVEEAVADLFARFQDGQYKADGTVARVFKVLRQFFEAVRNAFAGRGLRTSEGVMQDVARGRIGNREATDVRGGDPRQMVVWHGSPHEFDRFTLNAVGTGEGAQAYGWGLYFAGRKEVAEHYRRALALKPLLDKIEIDADVFADEAVAAAREEGRLTEKEAELLDAIEADDFLGFDYLHQALRAAFREPEAFDLSQDLIDAIRNQGRLYQVDIPEENEFLLWDKPLSEQSDQVKKAVADAFEVMGFDRDGVTIDTRRGDVEGFEATGNEFYDWLSKEIRRNGGEPDGNGSRRSDRAASLTLVNTGIAGIKYLDGTSRKAGDGTYNYVLFDDNRAQVVGKFSIPEEEAKEGKNAIPAPLGRVQDFVGDEQRVTSVRTMLKGIGSGNESRVQDFMDAWRVRLQDKMLPVLRLQDRIAQSLGRDIAEAENAYLSEEIMTGRAGARLEQLAEGTIEPLIGAMNEQAISLDELETYLYARHAPERNARIAEINPEFAEGEGSGMTDLEAAAVMSRVQKAGKKEQLEALAGMVDKMLADALQTRIEAGLISKEEAAAWSETYKHYVPLRGRIEVDGDVETARARVQAGLTVKGKESKRAFGRRSKADNILSYSILQAEEAILRAEKNAVAQSFLRLAQKNPNKDFWTVNKIERRPVFNKATGLVRYENQSRISAEDAPYTVTAKVDGSEFHVTMERTNPEAVKVAAAMRNLDDPKFNKVMAAASTFNRYFSAINTRYNPSFVVTNALRDVETAMVTLGATDVPGLRRAVLKDYVSALTANADPDSEWGRWRREWEMAGGKVYFNQAGDLNTIRKDIDLRLKMKANPSNLAKIWTKTFNALEAVNEAVERAIRLSVYKNAREQGLSPAKAASLSRNVTTNFTRKGQWGPALNAFYAFFNASTQGTTTFLRAVARSKRARRAVYGVVLAAFLAEFLNSMWSGVDDDGEKFWDKLPEFEKEKNLIIMIPGGEDGAAIKIPLAYGLNALANIGRNAAAVMRGAKSAGEAALNVATASLDAFNPLGSGGALSMIAPTVLDPFADMYTNENFAGKPIRPSQNPFEPEQTPSSTSFASTSPVSKAIAKAVNKVTGGDDVQPGAVSLYPDHLEYVFGFLTGGSGRFVQDVAKLVTASTDPEVDMTIRDVPIVKSVLTEKAPWVDKQRFYERVQKFKAFEAYAKGYVDREDEEGLRQLVQDNLSLARMEGVTKEADKVTAKERKNRREVLFAIETGKITSEQARPMLKEIEANEAFAISKYNEIWNQTMAAENAADDE